jgi:hypothetical protein
MQTVGNAGTTPEHSFGCNICDVCGIDMLLHETQRFENSSQQTFVCVRNGSIYPTVLVFCCRYAEIIYRHLDTDVCEEKVVKYNEDNLIVLIRVVIHSCKA